MSILDKLRVDMDRDRKVRAVGSLIRVRGLDRDDVEADPERAAAADALVAEHSDDKLLEDALRFATYLGEMADPDCGTCHGAGAFSINAQRAEPCTCARRGEQRAREAAPTISVRGTREADVDRRIARAKSVLADLVKRRDEAAAATVAEIRTVESAAEEHGAARAAHQEQLDAANSLERDVLQSIAEIRAALRAAEEDLRRVRDLQKTRAATLEDHDAGALTLAARLAALSASKARIEDRHKSKIEAAERTLRRLERLRGGGGEAKISTSVQVR